MDIEEMKKYAKNKIEADNLIKQVRQRIKETIWDKQNKREGFTETFKPLISQFEKPEDPKTKNIFTQNQEMLRNQLALTEGLRDNQRAITDGFNQLERLADMRELPKEAIEDEAQAQAPLPKEYKSPLVDNSPFVIDNPPIAKFNVEDLDKYLNNKKAQDILKNNGYDYLPSDYFDYDVSKIIALFNNVNSDLNGIRNELKSVAEIIIDEEGYEKAKATAKKRGPTDATKNKIENFNTLSIYSTNLSDLLKYKKQSGSGMFYNNPEELLHRLELLNGSLAAGNNGVLPEFIQKAHRLRDLGIITNNQLNTLLRKII